VVVYRYFLEVRFSNYLRHFFVVLKVELMGWTFVVVVLIVVEVG
jgi:hypothetical protein